ncbi:MAG: hypothetical protein ACHQWH_04325 [Nitrososphaerales archaeon]
MTKDSENVTLSDAFTTYKKAAKVWSDNRSVSHFDLDDARKALCVTLGYKRVHDHLGEYCNLHERDIPGYIAATRVSLLCLSDADISQGRNWSYNGLCRPVTYDKLQEMYREAVARSAELERWFMLEPVEKFIGGSPVIYRGLSGDPYIARFVPAGRDAVSSVRIEKIDFLTSRFEQQPIMSESEARSFFANLGEVTFTKCHSMSDQRKGNTS